MMLLLFGQTAFAQSDDCPAAELLEVYEDCRAIPSSTFSLNSFSTKNTCNGNTDDDGWFRFIAISPRTQVIIFSDQLANMAISAFEDCKTEIACVNERDMGGQEFLVFDTEIDKEYFVQVYDFGSGGGGFLICLTTKEEVFPTDCPGATVLCEDGQISFNPTGIGKDDFESPNNQAGCLSKKENHSAWYYFEIEEDAPPNLDLTFSIQPSTNTDFDFAVYGPDALCEELGTPIRCSFADPSCIFCPRTGLGMGATAATEGSEGSGFVAPLLVQPGQGFFLLIDNPSANTTIFDIEWGGKAADFLSCTTSLPCGLSLDVGNPLTVCEETQIVLTAQAKGNTQNIKYTWRGTPETISFLDNIFAPNPILTLPPDFDGKIGFELSAITSECSVIDSIYITKKCDDLTSCPSFQATISATSPSCTDPNSGSIQIGLVEGGTPPYAYQLGNNPIFQNNATFQNLNAATYPITIQDINGCQLDTFMRLSETILPTLDIGPDIIAEQGEAIVLEAISNFSSKQIKTITWTPNLDENCPPPCNFINFTALFNGTIQATLETTDNCFVSDELLISVLPKIEIYIPSAFSPNGDGVNDHFTILTGAGISKIIRLQIFDRWGNLVFQQNDFLPNDQSQGWDGFFNQQTLESAVYLYHAELEVIDQQPITKVGDVFLIR